MTVSNEVPLTPQLIPAIIHESDMARMERTISRLWKALIVTIVLSLINNALWIWYLPFRLK